MILKGIMATSQEKCKYKFNVRKIVEEKGIEVTDEEIDKT